MLKALSSIVVHVCCQVRGREGGMLGPFALRRGFVESYVVTYMDPEGKIKALDDPDTDDDVSF
jgi:hypothetical protein